MCRFQRFFFVKGFVDYSAMNGSLNKACTHFLKLHLYLEHYINRNIIYIKLFILVYIKNSSIGWNALFSFEDFHRNAHFVQKRKLFKVVKSSADTYCKNNNNNKYKHPQKVFEKLKNILMGFLLKECIL